MVYLELDHTSEFYPVKLIFPKFLYAHLLKYLKLCFQLSHEPLNN